MQLNTEKIDEAVLALLYLGLHQRCLAWKGFDWDAMERLHEKGMISSPIGKARSVVFTEEGLKESKRLFEACSPRNTAPHVVPLFDTPCIEITRCICRRR
jgi:hypothetical protein